MAKAPEPCDTRCKAVPDCFLQDPGCVLRDLFKDCEYLLDDLAYCIEHPDKDPCTGRRSKRTREQARDDALDLRDSLREYGGLKPR